MALFADSGSGVELPAVIVAVIEPVAGATKLTLQKIALDAVSGVAVGTVGVQLVVAPAGSPEISHVAESAALGPAFRQAMVPVTVCPAVTLAGSKELACISAAGVITAL